MRYAEVSVHSPAAQRQTFSYEIPAHLSVEAGQAVWVPFGSKVLQGIVLVLSDYPAVSETREIAGIIEARPLLSPAHISLAYWTSQYYLAPLFDAVALMLPPGFERKTLTFIIASSPLPDDFNPSSLSPEEQRVLQIVRGEAKVSPGKLEKMLGKRKAQSAIARLVKRGLVTRSYELAPIRAKPMVLPYLNLLVSAGEAKQEADRLRSRRAPRQAALLEFLADQPQPVSLASARTAARCTKPAIEALVQRNLVAVQDIIVRRNPLAGQDIALSQPLTLTTAQESALNAIKSNLLRPASQPPGVFLLHGVTGSGKTEVYLQALAETVGQGKRGIVLVPEIALTPQTIERFAARFPGRVAVLHSRLSLGEQFDEWQRISNGEADVVIGPRSALFAPQPDLGLIVIDEEHEWNYKQTDQSPRYHTRDAAIKLAELSGATVILGSATPDVTSYYHARQGDYHYLRLAERVTPIENSPLPKVEVVDLREELKAGNRSLFSRSLSRAISRALAGNEQVILFLNRRGGATFVQCRDCGHVLRCRRCESPLSHHSAEDRLICHQCNYRTPVPGVCPNCTSRRIKYLGVGTQKLEEEAGQAFPKARLLRWDSDTTRSRHSHQEILDRFRSRQADILIGTQMVTKGLDLPSVTLVGVISADTGLNLPDFRSGERTFQLLSQVAGRAGRGPDGGRVIIQTYSPEHYAVQAAAGHDYLSFYNREIDYRRQLRHPPCSRLAKLVFSHSNNTVAQREAERMKHRLVEERDSQGIADLGFIGPAPAFVHRLRGRFRWQLIIRGSNPAAFISTVPIPQNWIIDIDPIGP